MKLETTSAEELKQRSNDIMDIIDSSRDKLKNIFDNAAIQCDKKVQQILPQLIIEMKQHVNFAVGTASHDEDKTKHTGFLGLKREIVHIVVTENIADTSSVIKNIEMYSAKCLAYVNDEFENIFNKEKFVQDIKEIVLNAFIQSQKEFDENDILLPLQNVLDKISVPHISVDHTPYIDEIETRFKSGYAKNDDIHKLTNLQSKLLNKIKDDIAGQLRSSLKDITETLKQQALHFADQIEKEFCGELEKLQEQVKEKEKYINEYREFAQILKKMKANM